MKKENDLVCIMFSNSGDKFDKCIKLFQVIK